MTRAIRMLLVLAMAALGLVWAPAAAHAAAVTLQGTVTRNGAPVNNATVSVRSTGTSTVVAQTLTDPDGFYVLTFEAGTYDVVASDGTDSASVSALSVPVSRALDLTLLSPFVTVSGTFVDGNGQPLAGKQVGFSCAGAGVSTVATGTDGSFVFSALRGASQCSMGANEGVEGLFGAGRTMVQAVNIDVTSDVVLDLRPPTTPLEIVVQNGDGSPASVAAIAATPAERVTEVRARYQLDVDAWEPSAAGVASATLQVAAGPTKVQARLADGRIITATVDPRVQSSITLTAGIASIVSGQLLTPSGAPASTATGSVDCNAGATSFTTDVNGEFSLPVTPASACNVFLDSTTITGNRIEQLGLFANQVDLRTDLRLDLSVPTTQLVIDVVDEVGAPATNIDRIQVEPQSMPILTTTTGTLYVSRWFVREFSNTPSVTMPTVTGPTLVSVFFNNGQIVQRTVDTSVQTSVTIAQERPSILTVTSQTPYGEPSTFGTVVINCPGLLRSPSLSSFGTLTYPISPRNDCNIGLRTVVERDGHRSDVGLDFGTVDLTSDVTLDGSVPHTDLSVDVLNADGTPAAVSRVDVEPWSAFFSVATSPPSRLTMFKTSQFGAASAVLPALPGDTRLTVTLGNGAVLEQRYLTPATGGHVTLVLSSPPLWLTGAPGASNDGDSVSDLTEALGPNNGDGNRDGVPDYEQANVTSYPSSAGTYVTLEAPTGLTLGNVRTVDPATYSLPPQLVLPEGLTDFRVDGVVPGSTVTLKIYTSSAAQIIAYVKYQDGQLKILPFDRFTKFADRVEIRLTDGGPGDDDGLANGVIVDPGGVASSVPVLDDVPPTVTGTVSPAPNAAGWHRDTVTVDWRAVDPEPSSGAATDPADTVVSAEGANRTITSGSSCDAANNCATGSVLVSIDRTPPAVTVTRSSTGVLSCSANDALSGVDGTCIVGTPVQGAPGTFTVSATARDIAGNVGSGTLTYTVAVPTDRATVLAWIDQLRALNLSGRNAKSRDDAVARLRDAASAGNWTSSGAIRLSASKSVAERFGDAVEALVQITGTPVTAQVRAGIVDMTRRWVVEAIASAPARGVKATSIAQARQLLAKGDQDAAAGRWGDAVDDYAEALGKVTG